MTRPSIELLVLAACSTAVPIATDASIDRSVADVSIVEDSPSVDASASDVDLDAFEPPLPDAGCATAYPAGPYGTKVGDVIDNLTFVGKSDANQNGTSYEDVTATICLGVHHQNTNIRAILLTGSAMWCTPCQSEEIPLKNLYAKYQKAGGHVAFVEAILENYATQPPTMQNLITWGQQFQLPYDLALDPQKMLAAYAPQQAYPYHAVIRASTMTITHESVGTDVPALEAEIDAIVGD